ncbi:MAG: OmpA family protein [Myxococcales bacterium]|nr:OmpA family protein [Myxococcales bacterium]
MTPVSAAPATAPGPTTCSFILNYASGSSAPLAGDTVELDALGRWLTDQADAEVVVRAHADGTGSTRHNFELSEKRGAWIVKRLARAGVAEGRMTAQAFGEYVPLEGLGRDDDRNRRTVVLVRGVSACPAPEDAR